jgi:hypothetical protein
MIISYDFNHPTDTFANGGTGGTLAATATRVNAAGNPAKYRGIYFNGTDAGYLSVADFTLYHTFAVHAWVLLKDVGATEKTLFSKDRAFPSASVRNFLDLTVNASKKMEAKLSIDRATYT